MRVEAEHTCMSLGATFAAEVEAAVLSASPYWRRRNGSDHFWACTCVMMKGMLGNELWSLLEGAAHAVHSVPRGHSSRDRERRAPLITLSLLLRLPTKRACGSSHRL